MTQGAYASVNGIDLYYEVLGVDRPGLPLVMVHGGAYTFRLSFDSLLPALTAERKVIGWSCKGTGIRPTATDRSPSGSALRT